MFLCFRMEQQNTEAQSCDEDEEMFVDLESDELESDSALLSYALSTSEEEAASSTTQYSGVSSTTAVLEADSTTVVISSSASVTSVCDNDEMVLSSSECKHATSHTHTYSTVPSETASVSHRQETLQTPILLVEKHTGSGSVKLNDVTRAASVNVKKLATYSGLKDLSIVLTRIETMPSNSGCVCSSSANQQEGTELSLSSSTAVDEAVCHGGGGGSGGGGLKRSLVGRDPVEASPQKQQKMEDTSSALSVVTCSDIYAVCSDTFQPSSEHHAEAVEKTDIIKSKQEVTSLLAGSGCMASEDVTAVEESVADGMSAMNDAIADTVADVVFVEDDMRAADSIAPTTTSLSSTDLAVTDSSNSEQEVASIHTDLNSITAQDVSSMTSRQSVTEGASSLNSATVDVIADVIAVDDNSVAVDSIFPMTSASDSIHNDNSECEITDVLPDLNSVTVEVDVQTGRPLVTEGASSLKSAAVYATAEVESKQKVTSLPAGSSCTAPEDVTSVEESVTDGVSAMNDAIADTVADVMFVEDNVRPADSIAPTTSLSSTDLAVTDSSNSEQEVANIHTDLNSVTVRDVSSMTVRQSVTEGASSLNSAKCEITDVLPDLNSVTVEVDVQTGRPLVTEEASSVNNATVYAIAEVITVNDNSVAADSIDTTIFEHLSVMDNSKSEQEYTGMQTASDPVALEDVKTDRQSVTEGMSAVNDAEAEIIADVIEVNDSTVVTQTILAPVADHLSVVDNSEQVDTGMPTASDSVTFEDVKTDRQSVTEGMSAWNDVIVDVIAVDDDSLVDDSMASMISISVNEHHPVVDNSDEEVTVTPADLDIVAAENVKTDEELISDGVLAMNDAIASAIADVILVEDSLGPPDGITSTTSASDNTVHLTVVDHNNSEQDGSDLMATEDVQTGGQSDIDEVSSVNDAIANAIADVMALNDSPLSADSPSLTATNRVKMPTADSDELEQQKLAETSNADLVTGSNPLTRSVKGALVLPPPPSVTNAGSKMRMRMEAANTDKQPAFTAAKARKSSRWSTAVESVTVGDSVDSQQAAALSNKDIKPALSSDEKSLSEFHDQQETQKQRQFSDAEEVMQGVDWRLPPTKSVPVNNFALSSNPTTSGTASSADTDLRLFPTTQSSAEHSTKPSTLAPSLLDWKPAPGWSRCSASVGQLFEGNTKSSVSPLQSDTVSGPFCAPRDVDMRQPLPNVPLPVAGQMPVMVASSMPLSNVQLQNTSLAAIAPPVVRPPGIPPVVGSSQIPVGPVQVNHGQPLSQMGPCPAPAVCPPPVQPPMGPPPAVNCQVAPPGVVTAIVLGGPVVSPTVVRPPASSVPVHMPPPHVVPATQQPPPMSFSHPPPSVLPVPTPNASPQSHIGSSPGHTAAPVALPSPQMALGAPASSVSPHPHVGSSHNQTVPPGIAGPFTQPPPQMAPATPASTPPILTTPNASSQPHVGLNPVRPVPSGVAPPVRPVAQPPAQMALGAAGSKKGPLLPVPRPTDARFDPSQPPRHGVAAHPPQPVPPVCHPPPQRFVVPCREPPPPGVGPVPPALGPGMAPGPRQAPSKWGPEPPSHAAPPMWGPPPQGVPPPGFCQPYPGAHHPAASPEWRPPPVNPPGAPPYMQPGMPGPNWRPPMDYPPHDRGWWHPPGGGMPQWGPPHVPPDWSQHNTGTGPEVAGGNAGNGDSDTAAIAKAAREWAEWQQRYSEWYYTYFGSTAVPESSAAITAKPTPTNMDVRSTVTGLRQQTTENRHKTTTTLSSASSRSSAPTRAPAKETKVSKYQSAASAIPLPAKRETVKPVATSKPDTVVKTDTAAAFAKFAEKASSNINFVLGVYNSAPNQNTSEKAKTSSTMGECLLLIVSLILITASVIRVINDLGTDCGPPLVHCRSTRLVGAGLFCRLAPYSGVIWVSPLTFIAHLYQHG